MVLTPRFLPGFNASVDYFRIDVDDAISTFGAQDIINLCLQQNQQQFCDAFSTDLSRTTNPAQPYLQFRTQPFNAANQLVRGIDIDAAYRFPLSSIFRTSDANFTVRGVATHYLDNLLNTGIPTNPVLNSVGVNGGQASTPDWIYRFTAGYESPQGSITAVARGVSSGKYVANGIECQTTCPTTVPTGFATYDVNHVSGLFYVDLNLTQKVTVGSGAEAEFFVNVTNIFDRWPLLVPETGLAANSTYSDLLGRAFRVGFRVHTR